MIDSLKILREDRRDAKLNGHSPKCENIENSLKYQKLKVS